MNPELQSSAEQERVKETRVILEFMRHGEKDANKIEPKKTDEEIRLTPQGRGQAMEKGKEIGPQPEVALAWGSPKKRTQETATHVMMATDERINQDASLEEMEYAIAQEVKFGKKIIEDERLNFSVSGPEGKEMLEAFKAGQYLSYLVEKSDRRAIELGDKSSSTYTRYAGNIAEICARYMQIGKNFNRIATQSDKYEKYGNQLERYLATHQGVMEGFIAKVLEKTQDVSARDAFITSVGSGFKELQGAHIEILNRGNEQSILMSYEMPREGGTIKAETLEIDPKTIEEIIDERADLEKQVSEHTAP